VITLDAMMPGGGWLGRAQAPQSRPVLAGIPVVMMTIIEDKSLAYSLGAKDYIMKPIHRDKLVDAVTKLCGEKEREKSHAYDSAG
jgi:DNA-binding response OmpR family regulator